MLDDDEMFVWHRRLYGARRIGGALKGCAKYVCPADDARETLQKALDHTTVRGAVNLVTEPFFEPGHGKNVTVRNLSEGKGCH